MGTDIREVLASRAASYHDGDGGEERLAQVHGRIRRVRRRRTTLAASATALVVAGVLVLGVTLGDGLTGRRDQAPASLVGHQVPTSTVSLGFTFAYTDSASGGDGRLTMHLGRSDRPRLVRWASASSRGELTLRRTGADAPWVGPAGDFGDFVLIPQGTASDVRLTQSGTDDPGQVALAVYTLDEAAQLATPGATRDGITYRADPAGRRLLGAVVGGFEQPEASFRTVASTGSRAGVRPQVQGFCVGSSDAFAGIFLDGRLRMVIGCAGSQDYDATLGSTSGTFDAGLTRASLRVRIRPTDQKGRPVAGDGVTRVGAAVYTVDETVPPRVVEVAGHRWEQVATRASEPGAASLRLPVTDRGHTLVTWAVPGTEAGARVVLDAAGRTTTIGAGSGNGGTISGTREVQGGGEVSARVAGEPTGVIRLTDYRPAD